MKGVTAIPGCCLAILLPRSTRLPAFAQPPRTIRSKRRCRRGRSLDWGRHAFAESSIGRLKISRDGKRLLTVIGGGEAVVVWNVATGQLLQRIPTSTVCYGAELSADSKRVLINDNVPTGKTWTSVLKIYDMATGKVVRVIEGTKGLGTFALSPDGRTLALEFVVMERQLGPSDFVTEAISSCATSKRTASYTASACSKRPVQWAGCVSEDGKSLLAVSAEMARTPDVQSTVRHFDCATAKLKSQMKIDCLHYAVAPVWGGKGLLATGNKIWDLEKGQLRTTLVGGDQRWSRGEQVAALLPDGKSAVVSIPARMEHFQNRYGASSREAEPGRWVLWDVDGDREFRRLPDHWSGYITPDAKSSFTVSMGGAIRHWDLASGKEILLRDGPTKALARLSSPRIRNGSSRSVSPSKGNTSASI